ncbi:MAG TPA: sigma-70 family RNA polymerase sigma factor [Puia sp.]|jgi:RNA polymerase sigma-70 factor (ECF subfamily)|uniref:RNA polymerase sigma factor n=1 Tax=Puia sp. TaxID=2045100 RepID=UPI002C275FB6|nr:sigma-70 family RNA polymerase sigma factor [Puia sp.]HVU94195.1 sigma-70 family RNA polymerase sigma factor [Puia sp.]
MDSNGHLVSRLRTDDDTALQYLYQTYHPAVLANIRRLVHHEAEAEDILQNVFMTLWENRHKLMPAQSLPGWLFTASYYKSLEYLRTALRLSLTPLTEQVMNIATEGPTESSFDDQLALINEAMETLPRRKRMAFQLCRLEGKTYDEAATLLQISAESVKEYVKSCSALIRKRIEKDKPSIAILLLLIYISA